MARSGEDMFSAAHTAVPYVNGTVPEYMLKSIISYAHVAPELSHGNTCLAR